MAVTYAYTNGDRDQDFVQLVQELLPDALNTLPSECTRGILSCVAKRFALGDLTYCRGRQEPLLHHILLRSGGLRELMITRLSHWLARKEREAKNSRSQGNGLIRLLILQGVALAFRRKLIDAGTRQADSVVHMLLTSSTVPISLSTDFILKAPDIVYRMTADGFLRELKACFDSPVNDKAIQTALALVSCRTRWRYEVEKLLPTWLSSVREWVCDRLPTADVHIVLAAYKLHGILRSWCGRDTSEIGLPRLSPMLKALGLGSESPDEIIRMFNNGYEATAEDLIQLLQQDWVYEDRSGNDHLQELLSSIMTSGKPSHRLHIRKHMKTILHSLPKAYQDKLRNCLKGKLGNAQEEM